MTLEQARTLVDILAVRARQDPAGVFFELFDEPTTYGSLWTLARRYGASLAAGGVGRGDRVAILLPTCTEFFATFFGIMSLGAIPVPLYPTFGPAELVPELCTPFDDYGLRLAPDGRTMYFNYDTETLGGRQADIWTATRACT